MPKVFVIIAIIVLAAGAAFFWQKDAINELVGRENSDGQICIQVITPAKNLESGECKEFPTPCDVPEGWEQVESCQATE